MLGSAEPVVHTAGVIFQGNYPQDDPVRGLDELLGLFSYAERLGFQVAGVRQRHLEHGVSAALPVLAAAARATEAIILETDVIPISYEFPFRLAEDFATVAALAHGRLNIGVSARAHVYSELQGVSRPDLGAPDGYELLDRFLAALRGDRLGDAPIDTPYGPQIPFIQPRVDGLLRRVWIASGSAHSAVWAASRGLGLLVGNFVDLGDADSFECAERANVDAYLEAFSLGGDAAPKVGAERFIVPLDSATDAQRRRYGELAASRLPASDAPAGPRRSIMQRDMIGLSDQVAARLRDDPVLDGATELRISLPYGLESDDYRQILDDAANVLLPSLGWTPREEAER